MKTPGTTTPAPSASGPGFVGELLVEVFLARGATHHHDLHEAADELRELFACFGILDPANEALIGRKIALLERRAGRARLRLVTEDGIPAGSAPLSGHGHGQDAGDGTGHPVGRGPEERPGHDCGQETTTAADRATGELQFPLPFLERR